MDNDQAFRQQFDRESKDFHGGLTTPVPMGGARIPSSMPSEYPDEKAPAPVVVNYGPEYDRLMAERKDLTLLRTTINKVLDAFDNQWKMFNLVCCR